MDTTSFEQSLANDQPPEDLTPPLRALWHDGRGDWERAHEVVQEGATPDEAWVHAYLHRKEGDTGNARYWYARAGRPTAQGSLDDEWAAIVHELLRQYRAG